MSGKAFTEVSKFCASIDGNILKNINSEEIANLSHIDEFYINYPTEKAFHRAIESFYILKNGDITERSLDFGCGDGIFAEIVLGRGKFHCAVDIDLQCVMLAKERNVYNHVIMAHGKMLPFRDQYFSTILANSVLEHIVPIKSTLQELSRVLKKGGQIILTAPNPFYGRESFYAKLFQYLKMKKLGNVYSAFLNRTLGHYNLWALEEWIEKLAEVGIEIEKNCYYFSRPLVVIMDLFNFTYFLHKFCMKLFNKHVFSKSLRKIMFTIWKSVSLKLLTTDINNDENGTNLFIIGKKK